MTEPMEDFERYDGDRVVAFTGRLIGSASSKSPQHRGHSGEFATKGDRCSACRWFTAEIFRTEAGNYVLATTGDTVVPRERTFRKVTTSDRPEGIIESLHLIDPDGVKYIPRVSRTALEAAMSNDPGLQEAYQVEHVA